MHGDVFTQLSVVIVLAAAMATVMRLLRQPLIIGHILTGIIIGPSVLGLIQNREAFSSFGDIGIALLLFIIGLELNASVIRRLGRIVIVTAMSLLVVMTSIGFAVASLLHFSSTEALLIGLSLFFSSTIIIAKVLSDKGELTRLHGQIAIGTILLDDLVATISLLFVATSGHGTPTLSDAGWLAAKGIGLVAVFGFIGFKLLPRLVKFMAGTQELLFLFALAWGLGVATLSAKAGFSIEIGALFAGLTLAYLPYTAEIGSRLKPLRDFFIVLFFIILGEGLSVSGLRGALVPALIFSAIVIFIKPLTVMISLGLMRYTKRTGFKAAINLSQISEFSIILVVLAHQTGIVGDRLDTVITLVALITIATSTYLMQYDTMLYGKLQNFLRIFERAETREHEYQAKTYPLILFGYKKGGHEFVKTFRSMKKPFIVVDYNPDVIELLDKQHIESLYGDATDVELLTELHVHEAKLIVSTITDQQTNVALLTYIHSHNKSAVIICHADDYNEAAELYRLGATYVMLPHYIGSERISMFIHRNGFSKKSFEQYREKHLISLGKIASENY